MVAWWSHRPFVEATTESSGPDRVVLPSFAMLSVYVYMYVAAPTVYLNRRLNHSVWVEGLVQHKSGLPESTSNGPQHKSVSVQVSPLRVHVGQGHKKAEYRTIFSKNRAIPSGSLL